MMQKADEAQQQNYAYSYSVGYLSPPWTYSQKFQNRLDVKTLGWDTLQTLQL